jgi:hypothetical protein
MVSSAFNLFGLKTYFRAVETFLSTLDFAAFELVICGNASRGLQHLASSVAFRSTCKDET